MKKEIHARSIKSFVCRNTKLPTSKQVLFQTFWPRYGIDDWQSQSNIIPSLLFEKTGSYILEIGFGTGDSLFEMAKNHPDQNFIGIEVYRSGIVNLLSRLQADPLPNIKIFQGDAQEILQKFESASLDRIQIFFPDPWPKLRHHKRRLIQPAFTMDIAKKLKPQGHLHLATDWEDYAGHMMKVLSLAPDYINTQGVENFAPRPDSRPLTKYEKRGIRLGNSTRDLLFQRK